MKSKYLETAIEAAKEAAKIHKKFFNKKFKVESKSGHFDQVTEADLEAENKIVEIIKVNFPNHNFLGEENKYEKTASEYTWIIDPLDGTNNFAHGIPIFSISIALAWNEEVIVGVVYDPLREEIFYAEKNKGAFLNGISISVSQNKNLKSSILITGFYYSRDSKMLQTLEDIKKFFLAGIIGIRRFGSAALDLCYVASGRADGFWEFFLNPWDFAAGKLILEEAGGTVTNKGGLPVKISPSYIISSNTHIHNAMLEIIVTH